MTIDPSLFAINYKYVKFSFNAQSEQTRYKHLFIFWIANQVQIRENLWDETYLFKISKYSDRFSL